MVPVEREEHVGEVGGITMRFVELTMMVVALIVLHGFM